MTDFFHNAAAKSLQSCPTLCDPIDGSPPGSSIPGILQARILEWVAISFSNAWKWKVKGKSLSRIWLLATPWTAAYQAPPSMGLSRLSYSVVFLYFFALIIWEGFLISPCYSLKLSIQMDIYFLFSFAFHFSSFLSYCKASSDKHFAFLHFFFLDWFWSRPHVQCYKPPSIILQALCLSDIIPWIPWVISTV